MSTADYEQHRVNQLRQAQREFDAWITTLSPSEREAVKKLRPSDEPISSGHAYPEDPAAYAVEALSYYEEDPIDELAEKFNVTREVAEEILKWHHIEIRNEQISTQANLLQTIIGALLSSKNPKMSAAALAFAAGLHTLNGIHSQSEYASSVNLTRQALNKTVRVWKKILNLNNSAYTKSDKAHAKLLKRNEKPHWRQVKASATNILLALNKSK